MLIEMASFDEGIVAELSAWQPIGYRDYFEIPCAVRLRHQAYDALPVRHRTAFEQTIEALDKLASGAILALQPPCHPQNVVLIGEVIGPGIRRLIDRAAAFLNSDGTVPARPATAAGDRKPPDRVAHRAEMWTVSARRTMRCSKKEHRMHPKVGSCR